MDEQELTLEELQKRIQDTESYIYGIAYGMDVPGGDPKVKSFVAEILMGILEKLDGE